MKVAKVALATTCTAEVRMPAKMTGAAIGSCIPARICLPESPMPRAASMTPGLTSRRAVEALMRIGGIAKAARASSADVKPKPKNGRARASSARLGTARPMLPTLIAMAAPVGVVLTASATGTATRIAMPRARTESSTCVRSNCVKPGRPRTSSIWPAIYALLRRAHGLR
jgi:hypothetical protein